MAKREKTNMVTRRVIESRTYEIYEVKDGNFNLLGVETLSGRVNENNLAKQYKVAKVVAIEKSVNKKIYGVPIDEFMKIAVEVSSEVICEDTDSIAEECDSNVMAEDNKTE